MKAHELISQVISRHEDSSNEPIGICDGLRLEPMLNFSGKMSRKAYQGYRKNWHKDRKYCGVLDFKIMDPTGKMEHSKLLARSMDIVPLEALRSVYDGRDPFVLGLSKEQLALVCDIQCSFAEQEVNWGVNAFQLRTHFGHPTFKTDHLRNAVPRDFFMIFFERCISEIDSGKDSEDVVREVFESLYQASFVASKMVLMPPIKSSGNNRKISDEFLPYLRSNNMEGVEPWINPHLERINRFCVEKAGTSPYWTSTYQ